MMSKPTKRPSILMLTLKECCPECLEGKICKGIVAMEKKCPVCGYDLTQESGYFLGSMMLSFVLTAILTIPPLIFLKVTGAEDRTLILYPFIQYLFLAPLLMYYTKIMWVHVGYRAHLKMKEK